MLLKILAWRGPGGVGDVKSTSTASQKIKGQRSALFLRLNHFPHRTNDAWMLTGRRRRE